MPADVLVAFAAPSQEKDRTIDEARAKALGELQAIADTFTSIELPGGIIDPILWEVEENCGRHANSKKQTKSTKGLALNLNVNIAVTFRSQVLASTMTFKLYLKRKGLLDYIE